MGFSFVGSVGDRYRCVHTNSATDFRRKLQATAKCRCGVCGPRDSRQPTKVSAQQLLQEITSYAQMNRDQVLMQDASNYEFIRAAGTEGVRAVSPSYALLSYALHTGNNLVLKKRMNMASKSAVDARVHSGGSIWYLAH